MLQHIANSSGQHLPWQISMWHQAYSIKVKINCHFDHPPAVGSSLLIWESWSPKIEHALARITQPFSSRTDLDLSSLSQMWFLLPTAAAQYGKPTSRNEPMPLLNLLIFFKELHCRSPFSVYTYCIPPFLPALKQHYMSTELKYSMWLD